MPNYTPKLNLEKPLPTEAYNISVNNANADKIDTSFGNMEAGLDYYFAQNGSGTFTGLNNLTGYIHNVDHIGENMRVVFKNTTANTGNVTITINGIGPIPVLKKDSTQIPAGGLKANTVYMIYFDGTNFLLLGDGGDYGTAAAPQVLSGYTIGTEGGLVNGTIPTKNAQTYTPGTVNQTISSGQYLGGNQTIVGDTNLITSNIRSGVTMFGVTGNFTNLVPSMSASANDIRQTKAGYVNGELVLGSLIDIAGGNTIIPSTSNQTAIAGNRIVNNAITVAGSPNLIASNIKSGVDIFGVTGTNVGNFREGVATSNNSFTSFSTLSMVNTTTSTTSERLLTVDSLPFKPKKIIITSLNYATSVPNKINFIGVYTDIGLTVSESSTSYNYMYVNNASGSVTLYLTIPTANITDTGFILPVPSPNTQYRWQAYG